MTTNNKPKVSIIIPIWNTEKYLVKGLNSLVNQTLKEIEIICVNNGSTDSCGQILEDFAKKDDRIKVVNIKHGSAPNARNVGLCNASAPYITFADSDDWVNPECYEAALQVIEKDPEINLVTWGANIINQRGTTEKEFLEYKNWYNATKAGKYELSFKLLSRMPGVVWNKLYKKSIIEALNLKLEDLESADDVVFNFSYMSKVKYIYCIKQNFYNYVLAPNSLLTNKMKYTNRKFAVWQDIQVLSLVYNFYKNNNEIEKFNKYIFNRLFNSILYSLSYLITDADKQICMEMLETLINTLDTSFDWGREANWIRKKEFYRFKQLRIPYFSVGNKLFGFEIYRTEKPHAVLKFCGLKVSANYQKIFSIRNDRLKNHKVINIFGIKFKISKTKKFKEYLKSLPQKILYIGNAYKGSTKFKVVRICGITFKRKVDFIKSVNKFVKLNNKFLNRKNKSVKRRLFLTTGNFSLLNNLTIIKQLNEPNCEDALFIFSHMKNPKFYECCNQMASIHNFKKIYSYNSSSSDLREYFIKNKLYDFDEIYFSNQYQFIFLSKELYPNTDWILTDEGAVGKLARHHYCDYDKVKKIMMLNYLDKLDFFGLNEQNMKKIVPLDKKLFLEIGKKCAEMYPVNLDLKPEEKAVIFCGTWWEGSGLDKEQYFELQDGTIEKLISLGYKVFFKPHPRDPRNYINNPDISILKTTLPLECYNFDVEAVISLCSLATLHIPYLQNISGFTVPIFDKIHKNFEFKWLEMLMKKLTEEYTTPLDELLSVNPKLYTKQELKNLLMTKCENYINSKPLLSQNKDLIEYARINGYFDDLETENNIKTNKKELVLSGGKK